MDTGMSRSITQSHFMILRETRTTRFEAYWATVKRTLSGYRQISADNLWTYLAEIEFRYNRRSRKPEIFDELVTHFRPYRTDLEEEWQRLFDWTPRLKSAAPSRANRPSGFLSGLGVDLA